ncbi:MAG TPA: hypothetical protein VKD67_10135 [Acidimicrobiales bacterium]|nr:hypothetical protein [Acidimicrobiales bacterium]
MLDPRPLPLLGRRAAGRRNAAAGLAHGRQRWFGTERNVGRASTCVATDLGIAVRVIG